MQAFYSRDNLLARINPETVRKRRYFHLSDSEFSNSICEVFKLKYELNNIMSI